jgi:sugar phosphate isomerase/epimerase
VGEIKLRSISLHQLVAPEISSIRLVEIASELGCGHVCLFTHAPTPIWDLPLLKESELPSLSRAMDDAGISAYGITSFVVAENCDPASQEAGLARGARLGAQYASVRILDREEKRASDTLARLAELAAGYGIVCSIEFIGFKRPDLLPSTLRIIEDAGAGALSIDPLHLIRSETCLDSLREIDPSKIGYVQLCDGPAEASEEVYRHEARSERLPPGEGTFPLREILALAPAQRAVSLEVPQESLRELPAALRSRRVVEATRRLLRALGEV